MGVLGEELEEGANVHVVVVVYVAEPPEGAETTAAAAALDPDKLDTPLTLKSDF